jgi:hypothetical protein
MGTSSTTFMPTPWSAADNQYKANQLQQQLADEQQMTAITYSDANWNWGAWGPWTPMGPGFGFVYGPPYGW